MARSGSGGNADPLPPPWYTHRRRNDVNTIFFCRANWTQSLVITLDMGLLVAGTKYRGEFEERLKKLMDEIKQNEDIILFIDEVHTLIGAGAAEGCIGATTLDEYRKHIEKDPSLERRFQPVKVPEPTVDETIQILRGLRERYELHHKLRYTDDALIAAAQLSYQYISDRFLPDKAIDLIDEAGSRVRLRHAQLPDEAKELDKELRQITKQKNEAVCGQDFEKQMANDEDIHHFVYDNRTDMFKIP
ncbi:Chaperone protein ClpC1, chloroplastic [Zea mays]|uniref:Chaperone protein ClpC1, chloroplastic n=1 Tax=Zea mays TaxID=4577 RepID=A0A3L6DJG1_MAIZE|nr:Chaperone protein ClpC1, chloroplastic [Zea mays]